MKYNVFCLFCFLLLCVCVKSLLSNTGVVNLFLSKPSDVSVFLSSCLFARAVSCCNTYELETECPNLFNKPVTLAEPVQCLAVVASVTCFGVGFSPLMIRTQYLGRLRPISSPNFHFQCPLTHQRLVLLQVQWCMPLCLTNQLGQNFSSLVCEICSIRWPNLSQGSTVRL